MADTFIDASIYIYMLGPNRRDNHLLSTNQVFITVFLLLTHTRPHRDSGRVGKPPFRNEIQDVYVAGNLLFLQKIDYYCSFDIQI